MTKLSYEKLVELNHRYERQNSIMFEALNEIVKYGSGLYTMITAREALDKVKKLEADA